MKKWLKIIVFLIIFGILLSSCSEYGDQKLTYFQNSLFMFFGIVFVGLFLALNEIKDLLQEIDSKNFDIVERLEELNSNIDRQTYFNKSQYHK